MIEEKKLVDRLKNDFLNVYGDNYGVSTYFAPGRVNLIGDHTDYNGGHVFPCALTLGTYAVVRKRHDKILNFYSMNFPDAGIISVESDSISPGNNKLWTEYPLGVIWTYGKKGMLIDSGFDILYYGNIPNGAGLSSSASIEVLTGFVLNELYGFDVPLKELAFLCQYSENEFNRVNCGIMDQFAIAMGKKDNAIFLNTNTLEYKYVPVELNDYSLIVTCSNIVRGLQDSKYNERRSECEKALKELQTKLEIGSLGDMTEYDFHSYKFLIKDDTRKKRAGHAILENLRTIKAVAALEKNDLKEFGKLMNESHFSLSRDYEVTGKKMDALAFAQMEQEGVLGSRITGAGFGGCTVTMVKKSKIEEFKKNVQKIYMDKTGLKAEFFEVSIGAGPRVV